MLNVCDFISHQSIFSCDRYMIVILGGKNANIMCAARCVVVKGKFRKMKCKVLEWKQPEPWPRSLPPEMRPILPCLKLDSIYSKYKYRLPNPLIIINFTTNVSKLENISL